MEITHGHMTINTYEDFKTELDGEFKKSADGFCRIGYLLKVARDTDILAESGYHDVNEFALARYGLDKTQVSRFMNINDRFSVNGYSDVLEERYQNMGYSKLAVMLTLPDEINEEIPSDLSKSEIKAIKDEYEEEQKTTDIEIAIEAAETTETNDTMLTKAIKVIGESDPELYALIHEYFNNGDSLGIWEVLEPDGAKMYSVRIPGTGRVLLALTDDCGTVTSMRTGEKEIFSYTDMTNAWNCIIDVSISAEESYNKHFDSVFPKKEEVAPVQPKEEQKKEPKKEPRKEKKVQKAAVESPKNGLKTRSEGNFEETNQEPVKTDKKSESTEKETNETKKDTKTEINERLNQLNEVWNGSSQNKIPIMLQILDVLKRELEKVRNE